MSEYSQFEKTITETTQKILGEIEKNPQISSWQLKNKLQITSSCLYIALGYLISQNKITVMPDGLSYKITIPNAPVVKTEY